MFYYSIDQIQWLIMLYFFILFAFLRDSCLMHQTLRTIGLVFMFLMFMVFTCTAVKVLRHRYINCLVNCELYSMQYFPDHVFFFIRASNCKHLNGRTDCLHGHWERLSSSRAMTLSTAHDIILRGFGDKKSKHPFCF